MVKINGEDLLPCFDYLGNVTDDLIPCMPDGKTSACCPGGTQCATNVACFAKNGSSVLGGCTHGAWTTSDIVACPCRPRMLWHGRFSFEC